MYRKRLCPVNDALRRRSVLLLGPRRTGKTWFIRHEVAADRVYNLLQADAFADLSQRPSLIREALRPSDRLVVIDEIQKLPSLMDEVHSIIEDKRVKFLLTGSSARKLRRTHTSLMAGRAKTLHLLPFVSAEIPDFSLDRVLTFGTLPPVYLAADPWDELRSYAGDYLKEEIQAEALSRRIENFSRFLRTAALSDAEVVNFESVARDAQVPPRTIREYYAVLEDTLIGRMVEALRPARARKSVSKAKFFFFDVGVVNSLLGQRSVAKGTAMYGKLFEHFIFQELHAYLEYRERDEPLRFWGTHGGPEVDFVVGDDIAIEVKAKSLVNEHDIKGIEALSKEIRLKRKIVVSQDRERRTLRGIDVYPYRLFLSELWSDAIV